MKINNIWHQEDKMSAVLLYEGRHLIRRAARKAKIGAIIDKTVTGIKAQVVLLIAVIAACITCFFVPIDASYIDYFDFQTLACLYCTLAVVSAFKNIHIFEIMAGGIVRKLHNTRNAIFALVFLTYFASMLLANDMALLTFLPLGYFVLHSTNKKKYMAFTFIMQNIAANLGGMITPFGNPQNLYLYSYFHIPTVTFFQIMFLPFITATILIIITCLFVKKEELELVEEAEYELSVGRTIIYSFLFICSILIVFRVIPYIYGTFLVTIGIAMLDGKALKQVNYPLLITFCAFFVFAGNMEQIPGVNRFFEKLIPINPLYMGVLSCQFISNVPSAVLLSKFTTDYRNLLVAVNIGGLGTLIASLASLITFSEYKKHDPQGVRTYVLKFLAFNFGFLCVLLLIQTIAEKVWFS